MWIKGDAVGANKACSLSWTHDGAGYFVKLRDGAGYTLDVPDAYPTVITALRARFGDFDVGIQAVLFGAGGTHVYIFQTGFQAHLAGSAQDAAHPLTKVDPVSCSFFCVCADLLCLTGRVVHRF